MCGFRAQSEELGLSEPLFQGQKRDFSRGRNENPLSRFYILANCPNCSRQDMKQPNQDQNEGSMS